MGFNGVCKDNWCSLSKKEMELCTMWVIIYMSFLHLALSYNVILYPKSIITSVGNIAVNFTCTIQLETNETTVAHLIIWWKDNTRIVENDDVLTSSTKYSVYGISSAAMTEYTQILQVNSIQEADHGMYTCTLVFTSYPPGNTQLSLSSHAPIIIRDFISQPRCSAISSNHETGQQQVILLCACSPSYPFMTLHWINNMGGFLTSASQVQFNELLTLIHIVSNVSESSNQLFMCRATSKGTTDTKECVISNLISTTSIAVTQKSSEPFDERSTVIPTKTTHKDKSFSPFISKTLSDTQNVTDQMRTDPTANVTQEMLIFSDDKKTTTIAIIAVADMNDPVNLYASIDQKNVERSPKHVDMDDKKKANIYPLEYNGYKQESLPPMKAEKHIKTNDKSEALTSLSQDKGPNTNGDFHLIEENDLYSIRVHIK
ncbi:uncharacterized protein LOC117120920 [Anneissia japonica]|uniref:uncharacterized protein LOC117120920 n=1 Tax=Anneissia japonica TaxID=1529436 RepID=UPI00142597CD|nr:uncharacterized protein LOC117120920 [Anneissia japonica]